MIANALKKSSGINYPGLIAAWSAKGKTNDDEDRAILKDLTGNGHDITLNGFAFSEMSGYGGFKDNMLKWSYNNNSAIIKKTNNKFIIYNTEQVNTHFWKSITNPPIGVFHYPSYKLKISGLPENKSISYLYYIENDFNNRISQKLYNGINILPETNIEILTENLGYKTIFEYIDIPNNCEITFELLPEYPDALVFDGVDDYGINENMPILTDYTIIGKREYIGEYTTEKRTFVAKGISPNREFLMELTSISSVDNFGARNKITIDYNNLITWQNKSSYNQQKITAGSEIGDDNIFYIGVLSGNSEWWFKGAFYSAYLFDRSLDEQEIKEFIRKYIDPEYLLPSEIPTPDCYYDFSLGSNDDETRDTIKDLSGNGNDAVAHNFAWSGMSGYGGFALLPRKSYVISKVNDSNNLIYKSPKPGTRVVLHISGIPDGAKVISRARVGVHFEASVDGTYIIEDTGDVASIAVTDFTGECNIEITEEPQYPGALVLDGVDDYIRLDTFDSGFKTIFMLCSWKIENIINYDQRNNNDYENALNTSSQDINYYGRNRSGKTYINGILSTKVKNNLTKNKKHLITGTFFGGSNTTTPCIGSNNSGNGYFSNLTLYKFLGFKDELTEEQIQAIIKKYNLLDGVDEIEVS